MAGDLRRQTPHQVGRATREQITRARWSSWRRSKLQVAATDRAVYAARPYADALARDRRRGSYSPALSEHVRGPILLFGRKETKTRPLVLLLTANRGSVRGLQLQSHASQARTLLDELRAQGSREVRCYIVRPKKGVAVPAKARLHDRRGDPDRSQHAGCRWTTRDVGRRRACRGTGSRRVSRERRYIDVVLFFTCVRVRWFVYEPMIDAAASRSPGPSPCHGRPQRGRVRRRRTSCSNPDAGYDPRTASSRRYIRRRAYTTAPRGERSRLSRAQQALRDEERQPITPADDMLEHAARALYNRKLVKSPDHARRSLEIVGGSAARRSKSIPNSATRQHIMSETIGKVVPGHRSGSSTCEFDAGPPA